MKGIYLITLFAIGGCIVLNVHFLFNMELYRSVYGLIVSIITAASFLLYLTIAFIRKQKLKKEINAEYDKLLGKN